MEVDEMNVGELLRDEAQKSRTLEIIQLLDKLAVEKPDDKETIERIISRIEGKYLTD